MRREERGKRWWNHRFPSALPADRGGRVSSGNKEWTAADLTKFRFWLKDYLLWILSSPITQQEATSANNHGSWHDAQITVLCAFLGLEGLAQKLIQEKTLPRMKNQITFLGEQPFEFVRTLSLSYSCFNLLALMRIDAYAGQWGFHLWDEGINRAFHYLAPYLCRPEKWPFLQIAAWDKVEFIQLCSMVNDFEESYDVLRIIRPLVPQICCSAFLPVIDEAET